MTIQDLMKFCGTDDMRPMLRTPCIRDGYTWATDGRMMVRVPMIEGVEDNPDFPKVGGVWHQFTTEPVEWSSLPPPPEIEMVECGMCNGSGTHGCLYCDHEHPCDSCDGTGQYEKVTSHQIGNRLLCGRYLRLLATLPNVVVALGHGDQFYPLAFKFDGGEGLLMPMKKEA